MITLFIVAAVGFVFGYFCACLMVMAKGNTIDSEVHNNPMGAGFAHKDSKK